jgi:hypothetical protein
MVAPATAWDKGSSPPITVQGTATVAGSLFVTDATGSLTVLRAPLSARSVSPSSNGPVSRKQCFSDCIVMRKTGARAGSPLTLASSRSARARFNSRPKRPQSQSLAHLARPRTS